jgi:membrane-bound serine protease (ClpP class)
VAGILLSLLGWAGAASGQTDGPVPPTVSIIKVSGRVDPVVADFVSRSLASSRTRTADAVVLQVDSEGVLDDAGFDRVKQDLRELAALPVPAVGIWVGPPGANAGGRVGELLEPDLSDVSALAPGSRAEVDGRSLGEAEARERGVVDVDENCDDQEGPVDLCPGAAKNFLRSVLPGSGQADFAPRFAPFPLVDQFLHTVASPEVAYLLFVIGMALLVFELFTAGVGIAGVVGAACLLLGCYGLAVVPVHPWAVALLVLSMFGFAVDVQTGVPRFWTGVGCVTLVVGSIFLYDGVGMSWVTLVAGLVGIGLAMLGGMPAMVRTRFSTPTIGREWMLGEEGTARTAVDPEGVVLVRGAPWRARTNRSTPIGVGEAVRVRAIERLVLEVEPLVGAARDYRERSGSQE